MLKKFKNVKCLLEEMITYKNKLVKIFKGKTKCYKTSKKKNNNNNNNNNTNKKKKNFKICKMSWRGNDQIQKNEVVKIFKAKTKC